MEYDILQLEKKELDLRIGCSVDGRVIPTYETRVKKEEKAMTAEKEMTALIDCFSVPKAKTEKGTEKGKGKQKEKQEAKTGKRRKERESNKGEGQSRDKPSRTASLASSVVSSFKTAQSADCLPISGDKSKSKNPSSSSTSDNNTTSEPSGKKHKLRNAWSSLAGLSLHASRRREDKQKSREGNEDRFHPF